MLDTSGTNGTKTRTGKAEAIAPPEPPVIDYTTLLLPIDDVHESKLNPRRTFGELEDLAKDIQARGLIEPLVVRERKGGGWEIAAGARRYRASKIARLTHLPCLLRKLTDAELVELAISENGKRSDLHPIEEAEGFEALRRDYGYTVEMLAAKFQKSTSHVYQHLKLLALCDVARKAFYEGKLDLVVAIKLARVPGSDLQKQALKELRVDDEYRPGAKGALEIIQRRFMLRLIDAPFDRADAKLIPGVGTCADCPKRTGKQPELFADIKTPDLCTDPSCFEKKSDAEWARKSAHAKASGIKIAVAKGYEGRPQGYVDLDDQSMHTAYERPRAVLKKHTPAPEMLFRDRDGKVRELVTEKTLREAMKEAGVKSSKTTSSSTSSSPPKKPGTLNSYTGAPQGDSKLAKLARQLTRSAIVAAAVKNDGPTFWIMLAEWLEDKAYGDLYEALERRGLKKDADVEIKKMTEGERRGLIVELCLGEPDKYGFAPKSWAEAFGVDVKKVVAEAKTKLEAAAELEKSHKATPKLDTLKRGGKKTTAKKGSR